MRITKLIKSQVLCNTCSSTPHNMQCTDVSALESGSAVADGRARRVSQCPSTRQTDLSHIILYCPNSRPHWNTLPYLKIHHRLLKKFIATAGVLCDTADTLNFDVYLTCHYSFFLLCFAHRHTQKTTWTPTLATSQVFHISITRQ